MRAFLATLFLASIVSAQTLAPTPPMGWNSWDSYGLTIAESEFRDNAQVLASKLKPFGWTYAVVDEGWYLANPAAKPGQFRFLLDANGRYIPSVDRFPSAANNAGFRVLADWVHAQGLQFGLHIVRGIPRQAVAANAPIAGSSFHATDAADPSDACPWNADNYGVRDTPAGQAYYDSVAALYASWGVDFVKVDCIASHPYKPSEIRMFSAALRKTGRPIVLSLSPGPAPLDKVHELRQYAQLWRISDDFWDHWGPWPGFEFSQGLAAQFATAAKWAPLVQPGAWPDADMFPLGRLGPRPGAGPPRQTRFTLDEQRTLLTLWSMLRSPLIMGGNLTALDDATLALLTNPEVLAVDQRSTSNRAVLTAPDRALWTARSPAGPDEFYIAAFNLSDRPLSLDYAWPDLGLPPASYTLRDLWTRGDLAPAAPRLSVTLAPHASVLYRATAPR